MATVVVKIYNSDEEELESINISNTLPDSGLVVSSNSADFAETLKTLVQLALSREKETSK